MALFITEFLPELRHEVRSHLNAQDRFHLKAVCKVLEKEDSEYTLPPILARFVQAYYTGERKTLVFFLIRDLMTLYGTPWFAWLLTLCPDARFTAYLMPVPPIRSNGPLLRHVEYVSEDPPGPIFYFFYLGLIRNMENSPSLGAVASENGIYYWYAWLTSEENRPGDPMAMEVIWTFNKKKERVCQEKLLGDDLSTLACLLKNHGPRLLAQFANI